MAKPTVFKLNKWLKKDGNSKVKLAYLMDLSVTQTVDSWVKNGLPTRFPEQTKRLGLILSGKVDAKVVESAD